MEVCKSDDGKFWISEDVFGSKKAGFPKFQYAEFNGIINYYILGGVPG